jgi:hypothetical protein
VSVKIYLVVPFYDKDKAKSMGAKWDAVSRQWYVPPGTDNALFKQWVKEDGASPSLPIFFQPMPMNPPHPQSFPISLTYCEDHGFGAYREKNDRYALSCVKLGSRCDLWEATLGFPQSERELHVFQGRLSRFHPGTRSTDKIAKFLFEALSETWDTSKEHNFEPKYPCGDWGSLIDYLCTDVINEICEHRYLRYL